MSENNETIRINKYLSMAGVLSRRKADEAIERGEVTINGRIAVSGDKVASGDKVTYLGKEIQTRTEKKIFAYYKPLGLVCTSKEADRSSIFRHIDSDELLYYVGRLDKDSQGLLLLTNDGELCNQIQKARNGHEKEYIVRVDSEVDENFLTKLAKGGIELDGRKTRPCQVTPQGRLSFRMVLTEGINREIRRSCEAHGKKVTFLKRIRVMNIKLGDMEPGDFRELTPKEEKILRSML